MNEPMMNEERGVRASGWTKLLIVGAIVVVLMLVFDRFGSIYVDWLWFQSVGLEDVFTTRLVAQVVVFLIASLAFFAILAPNALLAIRLAARRQLPFEFMGWSPTAQGDKLLKLGALGVAALLAILVGLGQASSWQTVLRYLNPTAFGAKDPLFGQDISFFVFSVPMYRSIQTWFMITIVATIIGCMAIYAVKLVVPQLPSGDDVPEGETPNFNINLDFGTSIKTHLSILVAVFALGMALRTWLDMFELGFANTGMFFGGGFSDINARWPGMWLTVAAGVLMAVLVLVNIRRPGYSLAVTGMVVWIGASILGGTLYPGAIQRFEVLPSELDKERPYLESNIRMTNQAYQLNDIDEVDYPAEDAVTRAEIDRNPGTMKNIRLWDPEPLLNTYNQIQSIRLYYDFVGVDVDRYMIDGEYRQVMVSPRELSPDKLPSQAQTWVNRRLQFTHGYGVAMSPVNEVTPEGLPELFIQDVPPRGKLSIARPEIYYGENTKDYVIVKTSAPEFDYPKGNENVYSEYQGKPGVSIGSYLQRMFFAWQFADMNIVLAGATTSDSMILYNRGIKERAKLVAPFLSFDHDPYMVVANQRLYWILDAYTFTDRYPYSQPVEIGNDHKANYLRNSVKAVIDAYDGSIQFYIADSSDPLVRTYSAIFPSLFKPLDEMPKELRAHLRYPQDLFRVQAELYRTYHMKDPRVFYNKEDMWNVPTEVYGDKPVVMEPYYVIMRLPGEQQEEFALILPYTPPAKNNMITWLAGRSDGDSYGKLVAYKYPKEKLIFGPMQIEARIDQDPRISEQFTLWSQAGSRVIRGNMIVIPVGQANLYVEPIYLQSEQTKLPEMKRVVLATGNKVVMEPSVNAALAILFPTQGTTVVKPTQPQTPGPTPSNTDLSGAARLLMDRYSRLQEDMKALENDLRKLLQSVNGTQ